MRSRPQPVFATHHAFNGAPSALPLKVGASPAECVRASPAARTLVGDFHDRFWLTREAHGDAAAAAATALAALSDDPAKRSVAAHLYAVRGVKRVVGQAMRAAEHRLKVEGKAKADFAVDIETAIGAALHSEVCHILDDVSGTHHLVCHQAAVHGTAPELPYMQTASAASDTRHPGGPKRSQQAAAHEAERAQLFAQIADLKHQVQALELQLEQAIRDAAGTKT